jgi:ribosomal protein L32
VYNLLVSGKDESWDDEPFILEIERCVREFTDQIITERFGYFTQSQVNEIKRFPCVFAYEASCKKDPKFGLIRDITTRRGKVKIEYEIIELEKFLTHSDISDMLFDLDISKWEMNRTHWAIKDVNLSKELASKDIRLPQWACSECKYRLKTAQVFV